MIMHTKLKLKGIEDRQLFHKNVSNGDSVFGSAVCVMPVVGLLCSSADSVIVLSGQKYYPCGLYYYYYDYYYYQFPVENSIYNSFDISYQMEVIEYFKSALSMRLEL